MNRRKGVPCGCDADPCGCSPKAHCIKAINNVSPDPNGDLNIKAGAGIAITQTGDDEITITNAATPSAFVEGTNIEFTPSGNDVAINVVDDPVFSGDVTVNGETVLNDDLTVNGDIIQNGAAYETHAEKIYSQNDYIVMRDGAVSALPSGDFSGFQVKKYDGTNDGRLVIDNAGVARVGDVGDEQPLMTRSESGSLTNGNLLQWNGTTQKAVDAGVNTSQIVRGSGNIGSDTKPIKVVNGVATEVTNALVTKTTDSYEGSPLLSGQGVSSLVGNVINQPAGSTAIIMIRLFTQNISPSIVIGMRVEGNQFWLQTGGQSVAGDYRLTATFVSSTNHNRTLQAEIFHSEAIVANLNIETIILK